MRKRMVHPELCRSKKVAGDPWPRAFTWVCMWMYLDDFGRGLDDPDLMRADIHPRRVDYTVEDVTADVAQYVADGRLCRYEVNGYVLLHAPSWEEHQGAMHVSHRAKSKLPPCQRHEPAAWLVFMADDDRVLSKFRTLPKSSEQDGEVSEDCSHNVIEVNGIEGNLSRGDLARASLAQGRRAS